jgi:hypothetical protein
VRSPSCWTERTFRPIFLPKVPLIKPRTLWSLCRHRHKQHTVRGFVSGTLGKKMGLKVRSFQQEGERTYTLEA